MKKNNLFKAIGIVLLVYILMSWLAPIVFSIAGKDVDSYQIGIFSIFSVILETFSGFGTTVLFVLMVGGFYGVLKTTGAYDKMMDAVVSKTMGRQKGMLIAIIILLALLSSICGLDLGLLIVFPFLIGLIVKMGYDKLVALASTVGATVIGIYGSTFAGTIYGMNKEVLGLELYDQILAKIILLVLGLIALIVFVLTYSKKNKLGKAKKLGAAKKTAVKTAKATKKTASKKATVKKQVEKKEVVKETKKVSKKKAKKERGALPAFIICGVLLIVVILGTTAWEAIFGSNWFNTAHTAWTGWKVGGFELLGKLFGGVNALGTWTTPERFSTYAMLLALASIILMIVYRKSVKETFEGFAEGIKSFVVPAIITVLVCSVFVFVYYNPVLTSVTELMLGKSFNLALTGIYTIINGVFYVDYYYFSHTVLYSLASVYTKADDLSIISLMFANLYGLVSLVAPTSLLLMITLYISEVDYTAWLKFIWKLAVVLFVISFAVFAVLMLI